MKRERGLSVTSSLIYVTSLLPFTLTVGLCLCAFVWETERDLPDLCEDFRYARLCPLLPPLARASTSRCHSHSSPRHVLHTPPDSMTSPSSHCQLRSDCCCLSCSPCSPLPPSPPAPPSSGTWESCHYYSCWLFEPLEKATS